MLFFWINFYESYIDCFGTSMISNKKNLNRNVLDLVKPYNIGIGHVSIQGRSKNSKREF